MNIDTVRQMVAGTDVHGIIQRVAYRAWEKHRMNADYNWTQAQQLFADMSADFRYMDTLEGLHSHLSGVAYFLRADSPQEAWFEALDRTAEHAYNFPEIKESLRQLQRRCEDATKRERAESMTGVGVGFGHGLIGEAEA